MNTLISILIPVYNAEKYIKRCLDSVLAQTYKNIEIVIMDDGSTDTSSSILEKYKQKNKIVRVISHENQGVSGARNRLISESKGEYILFVDSDDFILDCMVEKLYKKAESSGADLSMCKFSYYYEENNKERLKETHFPKEMVTSSVEAIKLFLSGRITGHLWNKLIKRSLFIENNLAFSRELISYEDAPIVLKLLEHAGTITFVDESLYYYLQRSHSLTTKTNIKVIKNHQNMLWSIRESLPAHILNLSLIEYEYYKIYQIFHSLKLLSNCDEADQNLVKEMKRNLYQEVRQLNLFNAIIKLNVPKKYFIQLVILKTRSMFLFNYLQKRY
jgi:glycosyltransferase involved in cell wall biosynthesis